MLGQIEHLSFGTGADALAKASIQVLKDFCTPRLGAPPRRPGAAPKKPTLDEDLYTSIRSWDPDAASDERSAGISLSTGRLGEGFENLRERMCDPTHAARRLLSRPQAASPYLKELCDKLIFNKRSISQMVVISEVFNKYFAEEVAKLKAEGAGDSVHRVINLRAAKHRLEKCATPLGNHILWVEALIATAIRVAMERRVLGQVDELYVTVSSTRSSTRF